MVTSVRSVRGILYERDFAAWADAQAEALRAGRLDALDLAHLAEEIGDLRTGSGMPSNRTSRRSSCIC